MHTLTWAQVVEYSSTAVLITSSLQLHVLWLLLYHCRPLRAQLEVLEAKSIADTATLAALRIAMVPIKESATQIAEELVHARVTKVLKTV
jgi:hypothetical protein